MSNIASGNTIAEIASLIGDAARANMLCALMGGQALTAGELSRYAGVTAQTTSGHLSKMTEARLIAVEQRGRHRYYRLASSDIADAIQALMTAAASGPKRHRPLGSADEALRLARTCYDHLAGRLAVAIADRLNLAGHVVLEDGAGYVTEEGHRFFCHLGLDVKTVARLRPPLCRTCLDWSERRPHLSGRLGAALLDRSFALGWVARTPESRALRITRAGETGFGQSFALSRDWHMAAPLPR